MLYRYDFFIVSQHVRQGTVSPTHYIVVHDEINLPPERMQVFTYKMTHLYYNWPGTVRVPAPCLVSCVHLVLLVFCSITCLNPFKYESLTPSPPYFYCICHVHNIWIPILFTGLLYIEGFQPEWCILTIHHCIDTPFWFVLCVCVCVCVCMCMCVHIILSCACVCVSISLGVFVYAFVCVYVYMFFWACMCCLELIYLQTP